MEQDGAAKWNGTGQASPERLMLSAELQKRVQAAMSALSRMERAAFVMIAAGPDVAATTDMKHVRQEIESDGLLFRVRVLAREVRDRQKAAIQLRTARSS